MDVVKCHFLHQDVYSTSFLNVMGVRWTLTKPLLTQEFDSISSLDDGTLDGRFNIIFERCGRMMDVDNIIVCI